MNDLYRMRNKRLTYNQQALKQAEDAKSAGPVNLQLEEQVPFGHQGSA